MPGLWRLDWYLAQLWLWSMLFCLSMNAMILGLLLAACISLGMATTISFVVIAIVMGKTGVFSVISKNFVIRIEGIIGLLSGAALSLFGGALFFIDNKFSTIDKNLLFTQPSMPEG